MHVCLRMSAAISGMVLLSLLISPATVPAQDQPASEKMDDQPSLYAAELAALEELKEKEGRDNAIIHYLTGRELAPSPVTDAPPRLLWEVGRHGWSEEARPLLRHIWLWQPALKAIRRGAEIGYAKQVVVRTEDGTVIPSFLEFMISTKILVAEARYFESRGEYHRAIENYLAAIKMGRDFTQPDSTLISQLIGIAVAGIASTPFQDLIESGRLDRESLRGILTEVAQIEETWRPITESLGNEFYVSPEQLGVYLKQEREAPPSAWREEHLPIMEDAVKQPDRIAENSQKLREFEERSLGIPYWQLDRKEYEAERQRLLDESHPYLGAYHSTSLLEAKVRSITLVSRLRLGRIAAAVELFRLDHDAAPRSLDQLVPDYLESVPVDPFTGKSLRYRPWTPDGASPIYSLGPDQEDDRMQIEYDGTNGTISQGDVFYEHR